MLESIIGIEPAWQLMNKYIKETQELPVYQIKPKNTNFRYVAEILCRLPETAVICNVTILSIFNSDKPKYMEIYDPDPEKIIGIFTPYSEKIKQNKTYTEIELNTSGMFTAKHKLRVFYNKLVSYNNLLNSLTLSCSRFLINNKKQIYCTPDFELFLRDYKIVLDPEINYKLPLKLHRYLDFNIIINLPNGKYKNKYFMNFTVQDKRVVCAAEAIQKNILQNLLDNKFDKLILFNDQLNIDYNKPENIIILMQYFNYPKSDILIAYQKKIENLENQAKEYITQKYNIFRLLTRN